MPFVVKPNHEMSLDHHLAHHQQHHRPQGHTSLTSLHSHSNSPHQTYTGPSQTYLTSSTSASPSTTTSTSSNVPSSSSSSLSSPSLSLTAGGHWGHSSHHHTHTTSSHPHSIGSAAERSYDGGENDAPTSSSYSTTNWSHPSSSSQSRQSQSWAFETNDAYNDSFPSHSSSTSSTNGYYSTSTSSPPSYPTSSSSLTNAVGIFSYSSLSGSTTPLPSSLASSTLPSSSSTPLLSSQQQERPKLEPASWNPHAQHHQQHPQSHSSQSQYYPLTINSSHVDLSMDEAMSPLTPISPSMSLSSPPSRGGSGSVSTMRGARIKQEDEEVEHTDGFVFEMPGPSTPTHPHHPHTLSSPSLLPNSRESLKRARTASMHTGHPAVAPPATRAVMSQFSPMSVVPLRATQASADMKKMMGAFRLDPFTMQNGLGERASRKRSNTNTNANTNTSGVGGIGADGRDNEKGNGKGKGKKRKGTRASAVLDFEDDLAEFGGAEGDEEEGLGKNWLGEDIGPLIGDTMLVEFEVGLVQPLLDPSIYPSTMTITTTTNSTSVGGGTYPSSSSNSDWFGQGGAGVEVDDSSAYGNERGRRGLGPSESNMMPFLSVVALSPRDYSLGSAHQALVARHLVAGEPAPKPLVNLSVTSSGQHTPFSSLLTFSYCLSLGEKEPFVDITFLFFSVPLLPFLWCFLRTITPSFLQMTLTREWRTRPVVVCFQTENRCMPITTPTVVILNTSLIHTIPILIPIRTRIRIRNLQLSPSGPIRRPPPRTLTYTHPV